MKLDTQGLDVAALPPAKRLREESLQLNPSEPLADSLATVNSCRLILEDSRRRWQLCNLFNLLEVPR